MDISNVPSSLSGAVLGMVLGGSCKFRTTPFILRLRKYSAVKNLIMKYFRHSDIVMITESLSYHSCKNTACFWNVHAQYIVGVAPHVISEIIIQVSSLKRRKFERGAFSSPLSPPPRTAPACVDDTFMMIDK